MEEDRARKILYERMLQVPHREITPTVQALAGMMAEDPLFTSRALVYLCLPESDNTVRDLKVAAVIALLNAEFPDFREAGRCLLVGESVYPGSQAGPGLEPYLALRAADYFHGYWARQRTTTSKGRPLGGSRFATRIRDRLPNLASGEVKLTLHGLDREGYPTTHDIPLVWMGLGRPDSGRKSRHLDGALIDWFTAMEQEPHWRDAVVLRNAQALRRHWQRLHLSPALFPGLHGCLFGNPPANSRLAALKQIVAETDERQRARLIIEHRLPFTIAQSLLGGQLTPLVGLALIEAMTPTEALNSARRIEASGLLLNLDIKRLYLQKVAAARGSVAAMTHRASAHVQDHEVRAARDRARDGAAATGQPIQKAVLVLADASYSMKQAIEGAREFVARVGPRVQGPFMLIIFKDYAHQVELKDLRLSTIEQALAPVRPSGNTSVGAGLAMALDRGFQPEVIVIFSDGGENTRPYLKDILNKMTLEPQVILVRFPGDTDILSRQLEGQYTFERFEITDPQNYFVYDQAGLLLSGAPRKSLVQTIIETPLPRRQR